MAGAPQLPTSFYVPACRPTAKGSKPLLNTKECLECW